ncbi:unnamed protein product [Cuscuta europaea]|uniref:Replication factor A C-terminal domain-containing protein n=1 Tax=Cuscuta europaea TaxID=41803 RepID=A0A9P0ZH56_CUSEU|nr:unnamed protein product [Cuscuta europaea]
MIKTIWQKILTNVIAMCTDCGDEKEYERNGQIGKMRAITLESNGFRIKLRVLDDTDSATFVLFERTVTSILNKSCSAMIESTNKITGPLSTNQLLLILWT